MKWGVHQTTLRFSAKHNDLCGGAPASEVNIIPKYSKSFACFEQQSNNRHKVGIGQRTACGQAKRSASVAVSSDRGELRNLSGLTACAATSRALDGR